MAEKQRRSQGRRGRRPAGIMGREQLHGLPVVEGENIVGMISLGDISLALPGNDSLIADTLRKISAPTRPPVSKIKATTSTTGGLPYHSA
jgi:CBS domain-containing protein